MQKLYARLYYQKFHFVLVCSWSLTFWSITLKTINDFEYKKQTIKVACSSKIKSKKGQTLPNVGLYFGMTNFFTRTNICSYFKGIKSVKSLKVLCYDKDINYTIPQTMFSTKEFLELARPSNWVWNAFFSSCEQLYVAVLKVTSKKGLKVLCYENDDNYTNSTTNVVYKEVIHFFIDYKFFVFCFFFPTQ